MDTISLIISYTGCGIENQELIDLLDPIKEKQTKEYNTEGSGWGLSIAKSLCKSPDHQISAKSEVGKGSEFFIKIKVDLKELKPSKEISINESFLIQNSNFLNSEFLDESYNKYDGTKMLTTRSFRFFIDNSKLSHKSDDSSNSYFSTVINFFIWF